MAYLEKDVPLLIFLPTGKAPYYIVIGGLSCGRICPLSQRQHILIFVDLFHHPVRKVPAFAVQRLAAVGAQDIRAVRQSEKMPLFAVGKGNILTFLAAVYLALCSELFIFNNAYYSTPRPNDQVLCFSFFRFGMVFLGAFVLIAVINRVIQKGYRRELD